MTAPPPVFSPRSILPPLSYQCTFFRTMKNRVRGIKNVIISNYFVSKFTCVRNCVTSNCASLVRPVIGNCRFESHQRKRLSRLTFFAVFSVSQGNSWDNALKSQSGHDRLLVHPLKFITFYYPVIPNYTALSYRQRREIHNTTNTTLKNSDDGILQEASTVFWTLSNVFGLFIKQRSEN